jgi:hypothetical protein
MTLTEKAIAQRDHQVMLQTQHRIATEQHEISISHHKHYLLDNIHSTLADKSEHHAFSADAARTHKYPW